MKSVLKVTMRALVGLIAGAVLAGVTGGLIAWIQTQARPTGWDGIFIAAGVLTAGLIGSAIGLVAGLVTGIVKIRRRRARSPRR